MALGVSLGLEFSNCVVAIAQRAREALRAEPAVLLIRTSDDQRLSCIGAGRINEMSSSGVFRKRAVASSSTSSKAATAFGCGISSRISTCSTRMRRTASTARTRACLKGARGPSSLCQYGQRTMDRLSACSWRSTAARGEFSEENEGRLRSLAAAVARLLRDGARHRTDASPAGVTGSIAREAHEACALA